MTNFVTTPTEISLVQRIEYAARKLKPLPIINYKNTYEEDEEEEEEIEDSEYEYNEQIIEDMDSVNNIPY